MPVNVSGTPLVPLHGKQGETPCGTPAFSNSNDEHFTAIENYSVNFFTGFQWQCVEFARRWLMERKGLLLPQIYVAAHIFFLSEVYDFDLKPVPIVCVRNGTTVKPVVDSLIIYPMSAVNFVGHVGVITEVGDDYVCVADQNRYFHYWGDKNYSSKFVMERVDGKYFIRDPEVQCAGWVTFPGCPNLDEKKKPPEHLKASPAFSTWRNLTFFARSMKEFRSKWHFIKTFVPMVTFFLIRQGSRVIWQFSKNLLGFK